MPYDKDYFICHASADKDAYARPLARLLESAGLSCWIDEAEILPGDSVTGAIDRGLTTAQYVAVLISRAFLAPGQWRYYELRTALAQQITTGVTRIVPLMCDLAPQDLEELGRQLPGLLDRSHLVWADQTQLLAGLERRVGRRSGSEYWEHYHPAAHEGPVWVSVVALPDHAGAPHTVRLEWGRWQWDWTGTLPGGRGPLTLRHHKALDTDGEPKKLRVTVSPPAHIRFGTDALPGGPSQETGPWRPRT